MVAPPGLQVASRVLRLQQVRADFQHCGQLDQFRLVLVGVVPAEQKFRAGWQLGAHACGSAAPIAPISPG
ncbi:MAG: hypothetical protein QOE94_1582 [Mycobacterium sp.]|jgi:hypothetical protein|nr:hypothetical protein [Mycobacterium sp.]